jgi:hypothetical protein
MWADAEPVKRDSHHPVDHHTKEHVHKSIEQESDTLSKDARLDAESGRHSRFSDTTFVQTDDDKDQEPLLLPSTAYVPGSRSTSQTVKPIRHVSSEPVLKVSSPDRFFAVDDPGLPVTYEHLSTLDRMNNDECALAVQHKTNPYRHTYPENVGTPRRAPRDLDHLGYKTPISVQPFKIPQMDMEAVQAGYDAIAAHTLGTGEADARYNLPRSQRHRELQEERNKLNPWQRFAWYMQCKPCWDSTQGCCHVSERATADGTGHGHGDGCCAFSGCRDFCCKAGLSHFGDEGCCEGCGCVRCCGLTHGVWNLCDGWFGGWKFLERKDM